MSILYDKIEPEQNFDLPNSRTKKSLIIIKILHCAMAFPTSFLLAFFILIVNVTQHVIRCKKRELLSN